MGDRVRLVPYQSPFNDTRTFFKPCSGVTRRGACGIMCALIILVSVVLTLGKGDGVPAISVRSSAAGLDDYQTAEILHWHNEARSHVAKQGLCSNMLEMSWSAAVAEAAAANRCPTEHNTIARDYYRSLTGNPTAELGENLAWSSDSCQGSAMCAESGLCGVGVDAVPSCEVKDPNVAYNMFSKECGDTKCTFKNRIYLSWYVSELQKDGPSRGQCQQGGGHCRQMVKQSATDLGCSYQRGCQAWATTLACNYVEQTALFSQTTAGLYGGCVKGQACSNCPASHPHCTSSGLCSQLAQPPTCADVNCARCVHAETCVACHKGYGVKPDGTCAKCSDASCVKCDGQGACLICVSGMQVSGSGCTISATTRGPTPGGGESTTRGPTPGGGEDAGFSLPVLFPDANSGAGTGAISTTTTMPPGATQTVMRLSTAVEVAPLTFVQDMWPLWERLGAVVGHGGTGSKGFSALQLSSMQQAYHNTVKALSSIGMALLEPCSVQNSYLYRKLSNTHQAVGGSGAQMPSAGTVATADELALMATWINEGCRYDKQSTSLCVPTHVTEEAPTPPPITMPAATEPATLPKSSSSGGMLDVDKTVTITNAGASTTTTSPPPATFASSTTTTSTRTTMASSSITTSAGPGTSSAAATTPPATAPKLSTCARVNCVELPHLFPTISCQDCYNECCSVWKNMPDSKRTFSSVVGDTAPGTGLARSMLNSAQAWAPKPTDEVRSLTFDLGAVYEVRKIATQGRADAAEWVTSFSLDWSRDGVLYQPVSNSPFAGNTNQASIAYSDLQPPVKARFVRVRPLSWQGQPALRAALITGPSSESSPATSTTTTTTTTTPTTATTTTTTTKPTTTTTTPPTTTTSTTRTTTTTTTTPLRVSTAAASISTPTMPATAQTEPAIVSTSTPTTTTSTTRTTTTTPLRVSTAAASTSTPTMPANTQTEPAIVSTSTTTTTRPSTPPQSLPAVVSTSTMPAVATTSTSIFTTSTKPSTTITTTTSVPKVSESAAATSTAWPATAIPPLSFETDIFPLLVALQVRQGHGVGNAGAGLVMTDAQTAYTNLINVQSVQQPILSLVKPCDAAMSYLYYKLSGQHLLVSGEGSRMPPIGVQATTDQLAMLATWINEGVRFKSSSRPMCGGSAPVYPQPNTLTFADDIYPMWVRKQARSGHGTTAGRAPLMSDVYAAFASTVNVPAQEQPLLRLIRPCSHEQSYLYHKMSGAHLNVRGTGLIMPPTGNPASEDELAMLATWINEGIRFDSQSAPVDCKDPLAIERATGVRPRVQAQCTGEMQDPWRSGTLVECCQGLQPCFHNWSGQSNRYFLCTSTCVNGVPPTSPPAGMCTPKDANPYPLNAAMKPCCYGLQPCRKDWLGDGNVFSLCKWSCEDPAATPASPAAPASGACTQYGANPWPEGSAWKNCCAGLQSCLKDFTYLCLRSCDENMQVSQTAAPQPGVCTPQDFDPWPTGEPYRTCCPGLTTCFKDWYNNGSPFYLCKASCSGTAPPTVAPSSLPCTLAGQDPWPLGSAFRACCGNLQVCYGDWLGLGQKSYLCQQSCGTNSIAVQPSTMAVAVDDQCVAYGADPWPLSAPKMKACCSGLFACLSDWLGTSKPYYRCIEPAACLVANSQASQQAKHTPAPTVSSAALCTPLGADPWPLSAPTMKACCAGLTACLKDWSGNNKQFYLCMPTCDTAFAPAAMQYNPTPTSAPTQPTATNANAAAGASPSSSACTAEHHDPWPTGGSFRPCCGQLQACLWDWSGKGLEFYLCKTTCQRSSSTFPPTIDPKAGMPPTVNANAVCAPDGFDPWPMGALAMKQCCSGLQLCLKDWLYNNAPFYLCLRSCDAPPPMSSYSTFPPQSAAATAAQASIAKNGCTAENYDPWPTGGSFTRCCGEMMACLKDWFGDGNEFYLCRPSCASPTPPATNGPDLLCTPEWLDPWPQGASTIKNCCPGLSPCLNDWYAQSRPFYLCLKSCGATLPSPDFRPPGICTPQHYDPWPKGGEFKECCPGLHACKKDWFGNGYLFYICKASCDDTSLAVSELSQCISEGHRPWYPGYGTPCCPGLVPCLKDWFNNGKDIYLCKPTCSVAASVGSNTGDCVLQGQDPWISGLYRMCCAGLSPCLNDWNNDMRWYYKCTSSCAVRSQASTSAPSQASGSCTMDNYDPWPAGGSFRACCGQLQACLGDWRGTGNNFYLCKASCTVSAAATTVTPAHTTTTSATTTTSPAATSGCIPENYDPWPEGSTFRQCCSGLQTCLADWFGNGLEFYLCRQSCVATATSTTRAPSSPVSVSSCTSENYDPWPAGEAFRPCCNGLQACLRDWFGNGHVFYLCKPSCAPAATTTIVPAACTAENYDPWPAGSNWLACCSGLEPCMHDWQQNGNAFYLCKPEGACPDIHVPAPRQVTIGPQAVCTPENYDPWPAGGVFNKCCYGLQACLRDWFGNGHDFYLCKQSCSETFSSPTSCTPVNADPWALGVEKPCCAGLQPCLTSFGKGEYFYLCRTQCGAIDLG